MNTMTSTNIINTSSKQEQQRHNAGNLKLDLADTPVIGALLSRTAFGAQQNLDSERPQIFLTSPSIEFAALMQELLQGCAIGMSRITLPDGGCWAAIIYESGAKAVWCVFDPCSAIGTQVLKDWERHGDMHITFKGGPLELTMRQPLTNSLIAKLLATPVAQSRDRSLDESVVLMRGIAQGMGPDKQRLFVLMMQGCVFMPPSAAQLH